MAGEAAPRTHTLRSQVDAAGAAVDPKTELGPSPAAGAVSGASYTPSAAIVGADTNSRNLILVNKGQDGLGTTVMATLNLNAAGGTLAAADEKALPLSAVAGALVVVAGDVLEFQSTHIGTGIADPGGSVKVDIAATGGS